jgi:hypothetical protein
MSQVKFGAIQIALFIVQRKPVFGDVADALEFALHLGVLGFEHFRISVGRDVDWRSE